MPALKTYINEIGGHEMPALKTYINQLEKASFRFAWFPNVGNHFVEEVSTSDLDLKQIYDWHPVKVYCTCCDRIIASQALTRGIDQPEKIVLMMPQHKIKHIKENHYWLIMPSCCHFDGSNGLVVLKDVTKTTVEIKAANRTFPLMVVVSSYFLGTALESVAFEIEVAGRARAVGHKPRKDMMSRMFQAIQELL